MKARLFYIFCFIFAMINFIHASSSSDVNPTEKRCLESQKIEDKQDGSNYQVFKNCMLHSDVSSVTNCSNNTCTFKSDVANSQITWYKCEGAAGYGNPYKNYKEVTFWDAECTTQCGYDKITCDGGGGVSPVKPPAKQVTDKIIFYEQRSFDIKGFQSVNNNRIFLGTVGDTKTIYLMSEEKNKVGIGLGTGNSGLSSASCVISNNLNGSKTTLFANKDVKTPQTTMRRAVTFTPPSVGAYTLYCSGINLEGDKIESQTTTFKVVPKNYEVNLKVDTPTNIQKLFNSVQKRSANISYKDNYETLEPDITKPLVIKVGDKLTLSAVDWYITNSSGAVDKLVSSSIGVVFAAANKSTTSATCDIPNGSNTIYTTNLDAGSLSEGKLVDVSYTDALNGVIKLNYSFDDIYKTVEEEAKQGNCSLDKNGDAYKSPCPFPPKFETIIDLRVVPYNFKVSFKNADNTDINVMYFGQGNTPSTEKSKKVTLTALDANNNPLKYYHNNCAAIDTGIDLRNALGSSNNISLSLIDPVTQKEDPYFYEADFSGTDSTAIKDKIIRISKSSGDKYLPNEVSDPVYLDGFSVKKAYFKDYKDDASYPQYDSLLLDFGASGNTVILRGRINSIDADNADNFSKMPTTQVYYEFYCNACDLDKLSKITGVKKYTNSRTIYGWYIDESFSKFNQDKIDVKNIQTSDGLSVKSTSDVTNGIQQIDYNNANKGKYQVKVKQDDNDATSFPSYLLYTPFYVDKDNKAWGTSSNVIVHEKLADDKRDFGLDTGNAKNTRGASRTGGF